MSLIIRNELKNRPFVEEGTVIMHQHDNGIWEKALVKYCEEVKEDGTKVKSNILGFYKLKNGKTYLASIYNSLLNRPNLKLMIEHKNKLS